MSDEKKPKNQPEAKGRTLSRRDFLRIAGAAGAAAAASGALPALPAIAAGKPTMSTPTITCGTVGNDFIDINVCAGVTGAPAGFSIQWMTCDDFNTYGWPVNSDDPLNPQLSFCKASFSGNANLSRYNLAAGECTSVRIGEILLDSGASTNCPNRLLTCTCYVFRAFAHANSKLNRSAFTGTLSCSTTGCEPGCDPCVKSFGFWKQHYPEDWPTDVLANGMTVGCQTYTAAQLESILLATPAGGNQLVALAHQVINTRLNLLCDSVSDAYVNAVSADLASAEALMCTVGAVPPVGSGSLSGAPASTLTLALDTERGQFECP